MNIIKHKNKPDGGNCPLSDILFKKKPKIPYLSLVFALGCILVSVPTYFRPELYDVFGGEWPVYYTWQTLTHFLQHGSIGGDLPLSVHLICNLIVILIFGSISEKVLGAKRYFALILVSSLSAQVLRMLLGIWGNGASGIAWAFAPIAFITIFMIYRKNKAGLLGDFMFFICIIIFALIWIIITIGNFAEGWVHSNLIHLTATAVGMIFAFIWRAHIAQCVDDRIKCGTSQKCGTPQKTIYDKWDKGIIGLSFLAPAFIIIVLFLSISGFLKGHLSDAKIIEIHPQSGTVDAINEADRRVIIKFSEPVKKQISSVNISIHSDGGMTQLTADTQWDDAQTLCIRFSREILQHERIKILLNGFMDMENKRLYDTIKLEYGFHHSLAANINLPCFERLYFISSIRFLQFT